VRVVVAYRMQDLAELAEDEVERDARIEREEALEHEQEEEAAR
jgi:hypothetical protein